MHTKVNKLAKYLLIAWSPFLIFENFRQKTKTLFNKKNMQNKNSPNEKFRAYLLYLA